MSNSEGAVERSIAEIKQSLFDNALPVLVARLEAHKAQNGSQQLDRVTIAEALLAFTNFINGNKKFVPGPETDILLNVGIEAISAAATAAKERVNERRIILAG